MDKINTKEINHVDIADIATAVETERSESPYIPNEVYRNLPDLLGKATSVFTEKREKDVFLTGSLGVLSGCFPNLSGYYDGREYYPNLYTYVSAPAASGKGVLAYAKCFGTEYHEQIKATHIQGEAHPVLFIPGNTSTAAFMGHLQSTGNGIFFETEADTVSNTLNQDWAGFSDLLRKGFHHETFSSSRKTNFEYIEIGTPKLSMVFSGTPEQILGLLKSVEDGLFSRFIFYSYTTDLHWKDVSPNGGIVNYNDFFDTIGKESFAIISQILQRGNIEFRLEREHWEFLNISQRDMLKEAVKEYGTYVSSLVYRMGLERFRMAMVLSVIRQYDNIPDSNILTCSDADFYIANDLINTYKEHNFAMFESFPKQSGSILTSNRDMIFLNALPANFSRQQALEIGNTMGIKERTVGNRLSNLVEQGLIYSVKAGYYSQAKQTFSKN